MGFPLPAVGYVIPKGRGAESNPNNQENVTNRRRVTDFLNSIQDAYVRFPDAGRFYFPPDGEIIDVTVQPVLFEVDLGERSTLQSALYDLRHGGTIVVPRLKDLLNSSDESLQFMRDCEDKGIGFLPLDKVRFGRITSSAQVVQLADVVLMDVRNTIRNAIKQNQRYLVPARPIIQRIRQNAA